MQRLAVPQRLKRAKHFVLNLCALLAVYRLQRNGDVNPKWLRHIWQITLEANQI